MRQLATVFFVALFIAACSEDVEQPILTSHRYDVIDFGTPLADAQAKLQQSAEPEIEDDNCSYVAFAKYPDVRFMIEKGIVTRADAGPTIANSTGFSIGANSEDLQKANPEIRVMPHKYDAAARYMILASFDNKSALVFEESGGVITQVRAGMQPSVEYVEGCG